MPRGYPNKKKEHIFVIEEPLSTATRQNAAISTVERLLNKSMLETQSLKVVHDLILRDTEQKAIAAGPRKLLAAASLRNGHRSEFHIPDRSEDARPVGKGKGGKAGKKRGPYNKKPKFTTRPRGKGAARLINQLAQESIFGQRLYLFVLEHLHDQEFRGSKWLMNELHNTGLAPNIKRINGVIGRIVLDRQAEKNEKLGYRRTKIGREFATRMRNELESKGACIPDGYLAQPGYSQQTRITIPQYAH